MHPFAEASGVHWYSACYSHCVRERNCVALTYNNFTLSCRLYNTTNSLHEIDDANSTLIVPSPSRMVTCPYARFQPECGKDRLSYGPIHLQSSAYAFLQVDPATDQVSVASLPSSSPVYRLWRLEQVSQDANEFWIRLDVDGRALIWNGSSLVLDDFKGIFSQTWTMQEFCSIEQRCSIGFGRQAAFCSTWFPDRCFPPNVGGFMIRVDAGEWIDQGMTFTTTPWIGEWTQGVRISSATELTLVGDSFGSDPGTKWPLECYSICSRRDDCLGVSISERSCFVAVSSSSSSFETEAAEGYQTWMKSPILTHPWTPTGQGTRAGPRCTDGGLYADKNAYEQTIDAFVPPRGIRSDFLRVSGFTGASDGFDFVYDQDECHAPSIGPVILSSSSSSYALNNSYLGVVNVAPYSSSRVDYDYWILRAASGGIDDQLYHIFSAFNGIYSLDVDFPTRRVYLANKVANPHPWRLISTARLESARYPGLLLLMNSTGAFLSSSSSSTVSLILPGVTDVPFTQQLERHSEQDYSPIPVSGDLATKQLLCQFHCIQHRRCRAVNLGLENNCYLLLATLDPPITNPSPPTPPTTYSWLKPDITHECYIPWYPADCSLPSLGPLQIWAPGAIEPFFTNMGLFDILAVQQTEIRLLAVNSVDGAIRVRTVSFVTGLDLYDLVVHDPTANMSSGVTAFRMNGFSTRERNITWLPNPRLRLAYSTDQQQFALVEAPSSSALPVFTFPTEYRPTDDNSMADPRRDGWCWDVNIFPGAVRSRRMTKGVDACRSQCLRDPVCAGLNYDPITRHLGNCTTLAYLTIKADFTNCNLYWLRAVQTSGCVEDIEPDKYCLLESLEIPIVSHPHGQGFNVEPRDVETVHGSEQESARFIFMGISGNNGLNPSTAPTDVGVEKVHGLFEVNIFGGTTFSSSDPESGYCVTDDPTRRVVNTLFFDSDVDTTAVGMPIYAEGPADIDKVCSIPPETSQFFSTPLPISPADGSLTTKYMRLFTGIVSENSGYGPVFDTDLGWRVWCGLALQPDDQANVDNSGGVGVTMYLVPPEAVRPDECWYRIVE
jgi:hypothetical protein